jgi:hypothetical protein
MCFIYGLRKNGLLLLLFPMRSCFRKPLTGVLTGKEVFKEAHPTKVNNVLARVMSDVKLTEPLTAKHISLFFLLSLGVELRRELRQQ